MPNFGSNLDLKWLKNTTEIGNDRHQFVFIADFAFGGRRVGVLSVVRANLYVFLALLLNAVRRQ
jgi:hypothetical protein